MNHNQSNPRHALTLHYAPKSDRAPKLIAKGRGYVADRILELARNHNIPIRHDHNLLQVLSRRDLNEEIPPEVYKAVAEILAFIYRLSNRQLARLEKATT